MTARLKQDVVLRRPLASPPMPNRKPSAPTTMPMIAIVFALSTSLFFTRARRSAGRAPVVGVVAPPSDSPAVSVSTGAGLSGSGPPGGVTCTQLTVEPSL